MFQNESPTDFSIAKNRDEYNKALSRLSAKVHSKKLSAYPFIDGEKIITGKVVESVDPSNPKISLGPVYFAAIKHALKALNTANRAKENWKNVSVEERAGILRKAGELMRLRKTALAALMIREAGKPWMEADADVNEAIDFCNFYADEACRIFQTKQTAEVLGEDNVLLYRPKGVSVVISPWNFPFAITCGMTAASLVSGNTVILKPSSQTCLIAFELIRILLEAGVPSNVISFLPGSGSTIGSELVNSPLVNLICFTGSREVGLEIISKAAVLQDGQRHIKRVIAEMGGKNAIIIDEDADIDEAVKGVLYSAFGYAGQKCSACSRVIGVGSAYDRFLERLRHAVENLMVGVAEDPATYLGPVIDAASQKRILGIIEEAEKNCKLLFKGSMPSDDGFFVPPVVFRDVPNTARIWSEEIFGPVLSCTSAKSIQQALVLANDSDYSLTGGLYSRSPKTIETVKREFEVGNLYINRSCTGAIVQRQPFGGFKLSGIGSKAGGSDYLLQFVEPRTITENTMRRGFAPGVG